MMRQFAALLPVVVLLALPGGAQTPPRGDGLYATLATNHGAITVQLYENDAPATVRNFLGLSLGGIRWTDPKTKRRVTRPLYPGTIFHRVIPGFMIQGGDPTGTGDGETAFIPDEWPAQYKFDAPGRLAMAHSGPGTSSCQFFITDGPAPHLNGQFGVFGQVVAGQEVVAKIARVPRNGQNRPDSPVTIQTVTVERWAGGKATPVKKLPPAPKAAKKK
ncbi:MAG TPA: peptidylprolyl isomerase [Bryobacteraceae bacterium]|nr:peptidylprolyl isomerase [Bryobacteraceae bacterium]